MINSKVLLLSLILIILNSLPVSAQKERSYWYFGDQAGLHFPDQTSAPVPLTNSASYAYEGCASVSDDLGNLLFYTNGMSVYNKNHQVMHNGNNLLGGWTSTQAALIVKKPGSSNLYYIFTTDWEATGGVNYYVVDPDAMQGQGSVIRENGFQNQSCEKLAAVYNTFKDEVWVIVHGCGSINDAFYAYRITYNGVSLQPVTSQVGISHQKDSLQAYTNVNAIGHMKFSHDGTRLAVAVTYKNSIELFDFNNFTGVISNPVTLPAIEHPYGLEFSPDNKKLYATGVENGINKIFQFNLEAGNKSAQDIFNSKKELASGPNYRGALQLAPNGTVIVALVTDSALSVINDPNNLIAPNLVHRQIKLPKPATSMFGLPNFPSTFKPYNLQLSCAGKLSNFTLLNSHLYRAASWNFGDPESGPANTSTLFNPSHIYTKAGQYNVVLTFTLLNGITSSTAIPITIQPGPNLNLGPDKEICKGEKIKLWDILGDSLDVNRQYKWSTGETSSTISVTKPGVYWLEINEFDSCPSRDYIEIRYTDCLDEFKVPNILTVNGDNKNEKFVIQGVIPGTCQLRVFNRWGSLIYESDNYKNEWPDKPISDGVYFYRLVISSKRSAYTGWVTIVK